MSEPFISVLVTAYNREKYIGECLESILASTYQNFEVVIVDDASSDRTPEIARAFQKKDSRVRLIINNKNLGQFPNRNLAASLASYDHIKFLDSDDIMYSHCLEVYANAVRKFPEAGLFAENKTDNSSTLLPNCITSYDAYINHYWRGSNILFIGPSGNAYNKKLFFKAGAFSIDAGILSDTLLSLKLAAISTTVGICRDTFFWRVHDEQVTEGQKNHLRMLKERFLIDITVLQDENCPLNLRELETTVTSVKKRFGRNIFKNVSRNNVKAINHLMRSCNFSRPELIASLIPNSDKL